MSEYGTSFPYKGSEMHSPARTVTGIARVFPSLAFYSRMVAVYISAGQRAKKGLYSGKMWALDSYDAIQALERVGCRFIVEGMDNFKKFDGPCVFAANHMSTLETVCLPALIQPYKDATFVVKSSLYNYPIFHYILRSREAIAVARQNPREDLKVVLEKGGEALAKGRSVIVFPQSTRYAVFDPAHFNSIAIKLARKADVPVVPVALYTAAWSEGRIFSDFGFIHPEIPIRFRFGEALHVSGTGKTEHAATMQFIMDTLKEWGYGDAVRS